MGAIFYRCSPKPPSTRRRHRRVRPGQGPRVLRTSYCKLESLTGERTRIASTEASSCTAAPSIPDRFPIFTVRVGHQCLQLIVEPSCSEGEAKKKQDAVSAVATSETEAHARLGFRASPRRRHELRRYREFTAQSVEPHAQDGPAVASRKTLGCSASINFDALCEAICSHIHVHTLIKTQVHPSHAVSQDRRHPTGFTPATRIRGNHACVSMVAGFQRTVPAWQRKRSALKRVIREQAARSASRGNPAQCTTLATLRAPSPTASASEPANTATAAAAMAATRLSTSRTRQPAPPLLLSSPRCLRRRPPTSRRGAARAAAPWPPPCASRASSSRARPASSWTRATSPASSRAPRPPRPSAPRPERGRHEQSVSISTFNPLYTIVNHPNRWSISSPTLADKLGCLRERGLKV
jgi:hypothetical protein